MIKLQKYSPFNLTIFSGFYDITRYQRGRANCIRVRYEWVVCSVFKKICFQFCQMYLLLLFLQDSTVLPVEIKSLVPLRSPTNTLQKLIFFLWGLVLVTRMHNGYDEKCCFIVSLIGLSSLTESLYSMRIYLCSSYDVSSYAFWLFVYVNGSGLKHPTERNSWI